MTPLLYSLLCYKFTFTLNYFILPSPGEEDDGYLLVQLYHPHQHRTDFCVLDAKHVSEGPIARIKLKHHIPFGFHGTFTPEVFLPSQPQHAVAATSKL